MVMKSPKLSNLIKQYINKSLTHIDDLSEYNTPQYLISYRVDMNDCYIIFTKYRKRNTAFLYRVDMNEFIVVNINVDDELYTNTILQCEELSSNKLIISDILLWNNQSIDTSILVNDRLEMVKNSIQDSETYNLIYKSYFTTLNIKYLMMNIRELQFDCKFILYKNIINNSEFIKDILIYSAPIQKQTIIKTISVNNTDIFKHKFVFLYIEYKKLPGLSEYMSDIYCLYSRYNHFCGLACIQTLADSINIKTIVTHPDTKYIVKCKYNHKFEKWNPIREVPNHTINLINTINKKKEMR
jgi:hypothetical protein